MSIAPKIKVLVVDDSAVMRRYLVSLIARVPDFQSLGTASNGRLALDRIAQSMPDVVTMDVEMPEMDGLATLRALRVKWPRLPVVMCSSLTERGASATLDALSAGANDYVTKPSTLASPDGASGGVGPDVFANDLIQKLRALTARGGSSRIGPNRSGSAPLVAAVASAARPASRVRGRVEILAIGASTGGPNALAQVIPNLDADLRVPVVIVQHMPPLFTKLLADRLSHASKVPVYEATSGMRLKKGCAYVAPGDFHMEIVRNGAHAEVLLHRAPPENSCRPAVDVLFRSLASGYGAGVLAVVLTGMGQDGLRGCEAVVANGGQVLTQDEASSVVWGMPGYVTEAGLSDEILPLASIASAIARRVI